MAPNWHANLRSLFDRERKQDGMKGISSNMPKGISTAFEQFTKSAKSAKASIRKFYDRTCVYLSTPTTQKIFGSTQTRLTKEQLAALPGGTPEKRAQWLKDIKTNNPASNVQQSVGDQSIDSMRFQRPHFRNNSPTTTQLIWRAAQFHFGSRILPFSGKKRRQCRCPSVTFAPMTTA